VINAQYQSNRLTENELKNDFKLLPHLKMGNLEKYGLDSSFLSKSVESRISDIGNIKEQYPSLKLVVKGIMCLEDAYLAVENGADAVWISNNGSFKPDYVPSAISIFSYIA